MTAKSIKIFFDIPSSAIEEISENGIDINEIIRSSGSDATHKFEVLPDFNPEYQTKDLALVILSSGASAIAIGFAISQVLTTIFRRPHRVEIFEYIPARDDNGDILSDTHGKPKLVRVKKIEIIEPKAQKIETNNEISLSSEHGLVIKFSSKNDPIA